MVVTDPTMVTKVAVVDPGATVTKPGVMRAELSAERVTVVPPAGAAVDSVTVQLVTAPDVTVVGLHCKAETPTEGATPVSPPVMVPPTVAIGIGSPEAEAAIPVIPIHAPPTLGARLTLTTATVPMVTAFAFIPVKMQL